MSIESFGPPDPDAHEKVQAWRRSHSFGYLINVRRPSKVVLHRSVCPNHLGDADWEAGWMNWGSMGNTRKICSDDSSELVRWARAKLGVEPRRCRHCTP